MKLKDLIEQLQAACPAGEYDSCMVEIVGAEPDNPVFKIETVRYTLDTKYPAVVIHSSVF